MDGIETQAFFSMRESAKPLRNESASSEGADFLALVLSEKPDNESADSSLPQVKTAIDSTSSKFNSYESHSGKIPASFTDSVELSLVKSDAAVKASHHDLVSVYSVVTKSDTKPPFARQATSEQIHQGTTGLNLDHQPARNMKPQERVNSLVRTNEGRPLTQAHLPVKSTAGVVDTRKVGVDLTAFATYKLSYIDRVYAFGAPNEASSPTPVSGSVDLSPHSGSDMSLAQDFSHVDPQGLQQLGQSFIHDVVAADIKQERLASMTFNARDFYAKSKVTLLGEDEKTLVVRDYTHEAITDFKTLKNNPAILDGTVNKIIVNGKEI